LHNEEVEELMLVTNLKLFAIFFPLGILIMIIVFIPMNAIPFVNIPWFAKGAPRIYLYNLHIHHFWFGLPMLLVSYLLRKLNVFKKIFRRYELHFFYITLGMGAFTLCSQIPEIVLAGGNLFF
jgi:hypothetical protein